MKSTILVLTMAAVILPGCSDLVSVNPFVSDKEGVVDTSLVGTWEGEHGDLYVIRATEGEYSIVYSSQKGDGVVKLRGRVMKTGEAEFIDLVSTQDVAFELPVHCIARVWPEGALLKWAYLDSKWLREQASQQIASQPYDDSTLLTAPTEALRGFLLMFGSDPRAYEKPLVLTRVP